MPVFPVFSSSNIHYAAEQPVSLSVQYERFSWTEYNRDGHQLLDETGYRLGLRVQRQDTAGPIHGWESTALLYLGDVDYDGQTQLGEPVESTTEYYGGRLEGAWFPSGDHSTSFRISPLLGGGINSWIRKLDNTGGFTQTGYDEWWFSAYLLAGLTWQWMRHEENVWSGRAGIRYPIYNRVEYDFILPDGTSGVSVEPGEAPGYFIEFNYAAGGYRFGVFFEKWVFDRSETEIAGGFEVFQPESKQQSVGVQFGLLF